jgi:tetratricopeptide (TPR) repeat protein
VLNANSQASVANQRSITPTRKFVFRLTAFLLPLAGLVAVELLLRLFGYGYPTSFFLRRHQDGSTVLVENQKFGWRFFPRNLARSPLPVVLRPQKTAGTYRIFVFGESAAQGHPEPAYSFSRVLAVLLQEKYPNNRFEIINAGMTAINSHTIRLIAKDCANKEGDLWIIYMGHNEVIGPFGAGSVFGADTPNRTIIRATLALQSTRFGQMLQNGVNHLVGKTSSRENWSGLEMFTRTRVPSSDPRLETVYRNFQQNLADILNTAERAGVRTLLCAPASNLGDCAPFASMHAANLKSAQLVQWHQLDAAGSKFWASGKWNEAEEAFRNASALDEQFAETHYRLGQCLLKLNRNEEARQQFILARDRDALRLRADSRVRNILLESAQGRMREKVRFLDVEKLFAEQKVDIGTDDELFYEHVHLTFSGNYHLARLVGNQVVEMLPKGIQGQARDNRDWLSSEVCAQRLAWTPWDRLKSGTEMARWLQTGPFTNQPDHQLRDTLWAQRLRGWRGTNKNDILQQSSQIYQQALERAPNDWVLHAKSADLLEAKGDLNGSIRELVEASRLLPFHSQLYSRVGSLLDKQGKFRQAETVFRQALELEPDSAEAESGLGLSQAHQDRYPEAIQSYQRALKLKPESLETHINLGLAFLALGDTNAAINQQEIAIRLWPESLPARINRGKLLQAQGKLMEAQKDFAKAVQLDPNNPVAQFNLANILVALQRRPEAIEHYIQAARLRPVLPEVRLALGVQLRMQGKFEEAKEELATAVRLAPENAEAHFEFGRLLWDQGDKKQAREELQKTLELNPSHAGALELLPKSIQ